MNCHVFPCESWIWNRDECRYFQSKIERKRWYSFPTFRCLTQNTHPIEHICPAFKGDTLEDREHGLSEVVKAGDAPLGSFPLPATLRSIRAVEDASAWCWVLHHVTLKQNMMKSPWEVEVKVTSELNINWFFCKMKSIYTLALFFAYDFKHDTD